jgi:hypothetical protein
MSVVWDKSKPDVQKYGERGGRNMNLLTHLSDADGYMFIVLFPMGHDAADRDPLESIPQLPSGRFKGPQIQ